MAENGMLFKTGSARASGVLRSRKKRPSRRALETKKKLRIVVIGLVVLAVCGTIYGACELCLVLYDVLVHQ